MEAAGQGAAAQLQQLEAAWQGRLADASAAAAAAARAAAEDAAAAQAAAVATAVAAAVAAARLEAEAERRELERCGLNRHMPVQCV